MTYIEGYDPGGATGYVLGYYDDDTPFKVVKVLTLDPEQTRVQIQRWLWAPGIVRVVEDFRLRASNKFTADLQGDRLIGAMEFAQFLGFNDIPLVWQMPTDKAHVPDQVLKDGGVWQEPGDVGWHTSRHVNDAIIHVLKYLKVTVQHASTLKKFWG